MNDGAVLQQVLFFGLLLGGLYLLAIRPQRQRAQALAQVRASVRPGSRVITTAGIHAVVVEVEKDTDTVLLEVAREIHVRFASAAVVRVLDDAADDTETAA